MSALRTSFLNGTALALLLTLSCGARAQEAAATAAPSAPAPIGVIGNPATFTVLGGAVEFGGQAFLDRPNNSVSNNSAKFNQYGDREEPLFLSNFNFNAAALDGTTLISGMGSNVATNAQAYELDVAQPGQDYFTYDWVSTPNLRSNSAMTVFQGVGSNFMTVPNGLVTYLNNGGVAYPAGATAAGQAHTAQIINTLAPYEHLTTLGIQHDRQDVGYKWTPDDNWTVGADYSYDHRYGTQEQGFLFSTGTSSPLAQIPMPINDTTQNASIFAEYYGISPWGMKWNGMLKYDMSIYTDAYSQFTAENPFGGPGSPDPGSSQARCPSTSTTTACYGWGSELTYPDNGSNSITGQVGVDLPGFKSNRYMGTFQFTDMRQNATFLPMTINPALESYYNTTYGGLPRNSLNGAIDTTLVNNVITTRLDSQWQNKLTYRYYDDQNSTPAILMNPWILNDAGIQGAPVGSVTPITLGGTNYAVGAPGYNWNPLFSSYTKQDASEQINWTPNTSSALGASSSWERYDYKDYAVNYTNEWTEKLFGHMEATDWLSFRADGSIAWRRYGDYNWYENVGTALINNLTPTSSNLENANLADFNVSNRDRILGNFYADFKPMDNLTITPTGSVRWDTYPYNAGLVALKPGAFVQGGLTFDHDVTIGVEADYAFNSNLTAVASYMNEHDTMGMASGTSASNTYTGNMDEIVQTITAGLNYQFIPDKLALKLSASMMFANDSWPTHCLNAALAPSWNSSCGQYGGTPSATANLYNPAYPSEYTKFDRIDAVLSYKLDQSWVSQFGFKDGVLKLHYAYEMNNVSNWQANSSTVYMYSSLTSSTSGQNLYALYMGGDNPNYNAQFIAVSAALKF